MGLINDRPFYKLNRETGKFEKTVRPPEEMGIKKYYKPGQGSRKKQKKDL